uniref:Uncharacterized protein n=1 Tax=Triticum urartu TaxID=4572 RepID=A0A8R7QRP0_TRIUA
MDMDLGPLEPERWHSSSVEIFCWREGFCAPKQQGCEAKRFRFPEWRCSPICGTG